jgi:hypothetical protein
MKMDIERLKEIMAMPSKERQKEIKKFLSDDELKKFDRFCFCEIEITKVQEIKQHYDETYVKDYGDYQTIILEKKDFDWLIEQAEKVNEIEKFYDDENLKDDEMINEIGRILTERKWQ